MIARTLICLTALLSLPAAAAGNCKSFEQEFDAEGVQHVAIDVHVGDLKVRPSEDGKVHLVVQACPRSGWLPWRKRSADAAALQVQRDNERMKFALNGDKYEEDWRVAMPATVALDADVGVGDVEIGGLRSNIDLDIGVGDANIAGKVADYHRVSGDAGVGDISVDAASGTGESHRAVVADSESWVAEGESGSATIDADVGVGDAQITLE